jgi:uncharacterized protein (TIGR03067 family)
MPIKTIVRGYAIVIGLILMTAITIHMAVSLVERDPWVTLFNVPVAAPREVAPTYDSPIDSEPSTTRVLAAERSAPLEPIDQSTTAGNQDTEFDRRAKQIALKFRTANSTEQAKLRQELESLCEEHFEYRQKQRKSEIEQLSNRVDSLRLTQITRQANKAEILKRRLNDLLDPDAILQWEAVESTHLPNGDAGDPNLQVWKNKVKLIPGGDDNAPPDSQTDHLKNNIVQSDTTLLNVVPIEATRSSLRDLQINKDLTSSQLSKEIEQLQIKIETAKLRYDPKVAKSYITKYQTQLDSLQQKLAEKIKRDELLLSEAKYEGKTLSDWLDVLKTERSHAKIKEALHALTHLRLDTDPRILVQAIIGMSHSQSVLFDKGQSQSILHLAIAILLEMPSHVVINEFLAELNKIFPQKLSVGFRSLFTTFIASNVQNENPKVLESTYNPFYYYFETRENDVFAGEIRQRSAEIVSSLAKIAQKDSSNDDWVIESAYYILGITEQPCLTYPDLIPVAERVFSNSTSTERKAIAARMLGESDLYTHEVLAFFKETLRQSNFDRGNSEFLLAQFGELAEKFPEVVAVISDELSERWKKLEADPQSQGIDCDDLINVLAEIGEPAKGVLPKLKSIVGTDPAQRASQRYLAVYDPSIQRPLLHQDHLLAAIKRIEEAKPKSQSAPSAPVLNLSAKTPIAQSSASIPSPSSAQASVVEKTFDGIPYSNWLKMLETERKPEKLATGMEACSRLADSRDEHRIARGIFLAAALFEAADEKEQQLVWNAGWKALQRLPADVIAEELIVALQDDVACKSGREFQGRLIAQKVSNAFESFPKDRTEVLIAELVKVIQTNGKGTGWLLAGASNVWRNSKRPLNDFESLRSLLFDAVDSGPKITVSGMYDSISSEWKIIVSNLIKGAPETPDLAVRLMKHAGKSSEVVDLIGLIGNLGPHGEPAVPLLVDLFLEEWKRVETERRNEANNVYHQRSNDETFRHHYRRCQIIETIGEIGRGQNGYALLRQLGLIAPLIKERDAQFDGQFYARVEDALAKFAPAPESEPKPDLLNDFSLITGRWRFRAMSPGEAPEGATAEFKRSYMQLADRDGTDFRFERNSKGFAGFRFELDATKSPKQITMFKYQPQPAVASDGSELPRKEIPETRMEGIYELTETTLRIQLSEPGQPRPTELVNDKATRPKRQYLLEFDRSLDETLTKRAHPIK